ncbi:glycosyltransferase family 2 protein [Burkholderia cenocepacia]|uniref:glycosyltransferase family 2 protein n=1 Tax=Burkholderia cenocepacia TaxID=95486 RepID=UPI00098201B5|nr:glycosyltransferase family 2 protein [Burkholderia cenocepacia]MBR8263355.1 glycosyltransferase family 2 protein [Burkholderia cenocepacia]MDN7682557.1 glycosyltransferase family 2 protein [Burkholderia cenocepacia]MEB2599126.1 glycosyltransferase family 2 protein [Burkholderia cenocepacia]PRF71584.1 glycosyltransferase family 2 protein [Burkholderia cenocepacia]RQU39887.1 glycosyltransferase family 2 protein [Burkholderia cenocepacia]
MVRQRIEPSSHDFRLHGDGELSVSIVIYHPDVVLLEQTVSTLGTAFDCLRRLRPELSISVRLVDNGGIPDLPEIRAVLDRMNVAFDVITGHGNVGYGRGHNLAIETVCSRYHLVLNPDIDLAPNALANALDFLDAHPEAGLLTPYIGDEAGRIQYLCRRYPAMLDLFVRGFLPSVFHKSFERRLAHYEMRDEINDADIVWDPPIVSGCFMLFRTDLLKRLNGFDPRYFLYFEDYDLSLRTRELARIAYVPAVRVLHHGGGAARKGWAHIRMFAASAFKFYNRFGWRLW